MSAPPTLKQSLQLRLLSELSTRLQSILGSERFYQEVIDIIQSKFNYYSITLWSIAEDDSATLQAQSGAHVRHLRIGHILPSGLGITAQVVRSRHAYLSNDVTRDPNYSNFALPMETRSELAVPIIKDKKVMGVVNVESTETNAFDLEDQLTLETVAAQVAVAIANMKLFREAKDFAEKLKTAVNDKTAQLREAHERILEQQKLLQKENKALKTLVNHDKSTFEIIGQSPTLTAMLGMVDKIAPTPATVLIQGESGTGKELIARRLHFKSERVNQPYVTVNCGALQESLLESELFGHEKGAFTGAHTQKSGLCETAEGGTLFLDEIGEMSLGIQTKLLRFLQEGEFYRVGGKKPIRVDVRVVSATNRELETEVREGRFREDLYYRLNTITLRMPPLRKRKEDIPKLIEYFLQSTKYGGSAVIKRVDPKVIEVLTTYDWPGNIRELQNTIERLKILADNQEIKLEDVPFNIRMPKSRLDKTDTESGSLSLDDLEKGHILKTLAYHQGNKTKAAQSLGITIKTLYNKLHRYGAVSALESDRLPS